MFIEKRIPLENETVSAILSALNNVQTSARFLKQQDPDNFTFNYSVLSNKPFNAPPCKVFSHSSRVWGVVLFTGGDNDDRDSYHLESLLRPILH